MQREDEAPLPLPAERGWSCLPYQLHLHWLDMPPTVVALEGSPGMGNDAMTQPQAPERQPGALQGYHGGPGSHGQATSSVVEQLPSRHGEGYTQPKPKGTQECPLCQGTHPADAMRQRGGGQGRASGQGGEVRGPGQSEKKGPTVPLTIIVCPCLTWLRPSPGEQGHYINPCIHKTP